MKLKKLLLSSSLMLCCSMGMAVTEGVADPHAIQSDQKAIAAIDKLVKGQLKVMESFDAIGNLKGFVMQPPGGGAPQLLYADQAGKYVVYGNVFDGNGHDVSREDAATYLQPYEAKMLESSIKHAHSFAQGNDDAQAKMYVVADPNCSACHIFYDQAKPLIDDGRLQVHWILVTFLKPDSPNKAAAIMAAADPALAMGTNEGGFDHQHEEGGITSLDPIPAELKKQLEDNMTFFEEGGLNSTPTLIFYANGRLQSVKGMPRDLEGFIEKMSPSLTQSSDADVQKS